MSVDKEKQFDEMLERALRGHLEPVPADFTKRMLRQIDSAEEQRILARVVLQERLSLAGSIVLGIIVLVVAMAFPDIAASLTKQLMGSISKISQGIEAFRYDWQFYTVFVGVSGFVVYSLVDLLVGDS
jgi:hypothetical protein